MPWYFNPICISHFFVFLDVSWHWDLGWASLEQFFRRLSFPNVIFVFCQIRIVVVTNSCKNKNPFYASTIWFCLGFIIFLLHHHYHVHRIYVRGLSNLFFYWACHHKYHMLIFHCKIIQASMSNLIFQLQVSHFFQFLQFQISSTSNFFSFKFLQLQVSSISKLFNFKCHQLQISSTSNIFNFKFCQLLA